MTETEVPSVLQKLQKWGDYPGFGEAVQPTRFIPCKTPLSCKIIESWNLPEEPKHCLTIPILLSQQALKGRQIGMVLDLSNHETLYAEDIPDADLQYVHINLVAKVYPQQDAIEKVIRTAQDFWQHHPHEHIAIHCAYGFNRTGFVVCAFLILACGLTVEEALSSFATARPPGVRHEKFTEELQRRYGLPKSVEATGVSRSSMSSLRSDMACVAEFLDNGLGMEGLNARASSPLRARSAAQAEDSHSVASSDFYPQGPSSSWGRDSLLNSASLRAPDTASSLDIPRQPVRDDLGATAAAPLLPLARSGSHLSLDSSPAIVVPQSRRPASVGPSLGSQFSINNDSLGLEQRHIFDHFFDEAAHGAVAARAENKGRRRSGSDLSRRWHRSMLPCISADKESPAHSPSAADSGCSTSAGLMNEAQLADSPSKNSPSKADFMSSPFANVQADATGHLQRVSSREERLVNADSPGLKRRSWSRSSGELGNRASSSLDCRSSKRDNSKCTFM